MTPEVGQAKPHRACPGHTAFSIALGEFVDVTTGVGQVGQATLICPRSRLFSEWKVRCKDTNKETPVPLVPVNETPHRRCRER